MHFRKSDKLTFSIIRALSARAMNHLTEVKPETILRWQSKFIKNLWSNKNNTLGRKTVSRVIKNLILEMKQDNYLWSYKKNAHELRKINIDIHYTTVNKIFSTFRKQGRILPNGFWKKFPKMHWDSLFAMDFMNIDTLKQVRDIIW